MSTYRVDDRDSSVVYSKPVTGGHWSRQNSGTSFQNGLMLTRTRNANATLSFTGISISVYGLVSPSGTGNDQSSFYSVDGQNAKTYISKPTTDVQSQVLFYNSGTLPNGQHNLVLINLVELDFLWIDYFEITTDSVETSVPPAVIQSSQQITSSPSASSAQTTRVVTEVLTSLFTESSTTRLSVVTTVKSDVIGVDSTPTALDGPATSANLSPSGASDTSVDGGAFDASESKTPVGVIVGGVVGGLAVIILAMILVVLLKRRRRAGNVGDENGGMSPTAGTSSNVVPFVDGPTGSPVATTSPYSQLSSQPSDSQHNQSHMGAGHSGATHTSSTGITSSGPIGKRQYTGTLNDEARSSSTALLKSHQREMEQVSSSASPSLPLLISGYPDTATLTWSPMVVDDLPPSYQAAAAASPSGENPVLRGLANARKS